MRFVQGCKRIFLNHYVVKISTLTPSLFRWQLRSAPPVSDLRRSQIDLCDVIFIVAQDKLITLLQFI